MHAVSIGPGTGLPQPTTTTSDRAGLARSASAHDVARLETVAGRERSVFRLAQMVTAMLSIFGGIAEIMKEIIGRGLGP